MTKKAVKMTKKASVFKTRQDTISMTQPKPPKFNFSKPTNCLNNQLTLSHIQSTNTLNQSTTQTINQLARSTNQLHNQQKLLSLGPLWPIGRYGRCIVKRNPLAPTKMAELKIEQVAKLCDLPSE